MGEWVGMVVEMATKKVAKVLTEAQKIANRAAGKRWRAKKKAEKEAAKEAAKAAMTHPERAALENPPEPAPARKGPPILQVKTVIRCPQCRAAKVKQVGKDKRGGLLYYRCMKCGDRETLTWTRFKVRQDDPLGAATRVKPEDVPKR